MSDLFLEKATPAIRRLTKMMKIDKGTQKFLERTEDDPSLHTAAENSPEGGFHKILRLLKEDPIARIKYINVWENIPEKITLRDVWAKIRTWLILPDAQLFKGWRWRAPTGYELLLRNTSTSASAFSGRAVSPTG